jgi:hypothetical protein
VTETVEPTYREMQMLVHRGLHLMALKGAMTPEAKISMLCACWELVLPYPTLSIWPDWATELRTAGEPPSSWCPVVNPGLLARVVPPAV